MRVLYLTNYHNPYRDNFFELLGIECHLTVLFEQVNDEFRDRSWFENMHSEHYDSEYLSSPNLCTRTIYELIGAIQRDWDVVVVGCYNSPVQMFAILYMKMKKIKYVINSDGPLYASRNPIKSFFRKTILSGANGYLVAGDESIESLADVVGEDVPIASYPFGSLTEKQLEDAARISEKQEPDLVVCVGNFERCKGIDVLLGAVKDMKDIRVAIIGVGKRCGELREFITNKNINAKIEIVPFMPLDKLMHVFARARVFVLPSRQECWGLVVNESAAVGVPIVSTWGSGAAVEFLKEKYSCFLAEPGNSSSLYLVLRKALTLTEEERMEYSQYLKEKAKYYSIEKAVRVHMSYFIELLLVGDGCRSDS